MRTPDPPSVSKGFLKNAAIFWGVALAILVLVRETPRVRQKK